MEIYSQIHAMQLQSRRWQQAGQRISFVPTMGNLHAGHLALVEKAVELGERVVVSIFVNPLQFNDPADFAAYRRSLDADLDKLAPLEVDAVFAPPEDEMYPHGRDATTQVDVPALSGILEGEHRPGHFRGVTTVVAKLFNIVQPDVAVFGEKDFQQLRIIECMVADLDMPVEIIAMPTVREADGLAMSSRNSRLSASQRQLAPLLYQTMQEFRQHYLAAEGNIAQLQAQATAGLAQAGFVVEYFSLRRHEDLAPAKPGDRCLLLVAARLGETRLIDNLCME